jgi:hypothetical protein
LDEVSEYDKVLPVRYQKYDIFEPYDLLDHFLFLRKSTITSFFITSLVDTPIILKKSKSLFLPSFELPLKRFTNYLMRGGLQAKALKGLTESIFNFSLVW